MLDRYSASVGEYLDRLPTSDGKRFISAFERGSLTIELYAPRGADPQSPHTRDEIYVVVSGQGTFAVGSERRPFGPGDILFVAAGVEHRFVDFSDDLAVWVIFYGAVGGEANA
jgi:mannose-6-phosphate isomerase-like protein (cupin superfamily)